jgi:hypothetical protein
MNQHLIGKLLMYAVRHTAESVQGNTYALITVKTSRTTLVKQR